VAVHLAVADAMTVIVLRSMSVQDIYFSLRS